MTYARIGPLSKPTDLVLAGAPNCSFSAYDRPLGSDQNPWAEHHGQKGWFLSLVGHFSVFITLARSEPPGKTQLVSARLWLIAGAAVRCFP